MSLLRALLSSTHLPSSTPLGCCRHPLLLASARGGGAALAALSSLEVDAAARLARALGASSSVDLARLEGRLDVVRADLRALERSLAGEAR